MYQHSELLSGATAFFSSFLFLFSLGASAQIVSACCGVRWGGFALESFDICGGWREAYRGLEGGEPTLQVFLGVGNDTATALALVCNDESPPPVADNDPVDRRLRVEADGQLCDCA